jgi:hypothetical protein
VKDGKKNTSKKKQAQSKSKQAASTPLSEQQNMSGKHFIIFCGNFTYYLVRNSVFCSLYKLTVKKYMRKIEQPLFFRKKILKKCLAGVRLMAIL